jgi:hypothetical protein
MSPLQIVKVLSLFMHVQVWVQIQVQLKGVVETAVCLSAHEFVQSKDAGEVPFLPDSTHKAYKRLIKECWHSKPQRRPTFTTILEKLEVVPIWPVAVAVAVGVPVCVCGHSVLRRGRVLCA